MSPAAPVAQRQEVDATVIITAYNNSRTLSATLEALRNPASCSYEVIVADDGSSDSTEDLVIHARKTMPVCVRHVWQPDLGFRAAKVRNAALEMAMGRVVIFMDGDMLFGPQTVQEHVSRHRDKETHLVVGRRTWYGPMVPEEFEAALEHARPARSTELLQRLPRPEDTLRREHDELMFRQSVWKSEHPWKAFYTAHSSATNFPALRFDESFVGWGGEDWELGYRLIARHRWTLRYDSRLSAAHIDIEGAFFNPIRTRNSVGIEQFLQNVCRFVCAWPSVIQAGVLETFRRFRYDSGAQRWLVREDSEGSFADAPILDVVLNALRDTPLSLTSEAKALLEVIKQSGWETMEP